MSCGAQYFFARSGAALIVEILQAALNTYACIIGVAAPAPATEDFTQKQNNLKINDWMLTQDYGVKVSRQNNIPMEMIEAYGFPPVNL